MALHLRQQFRGRARLTIREAIKDLTALTNHDIRTPNNKILTVAEQAVVGGLIIYLNASLAAQIPR